MAVSKLLCTLGFAAVNLVGASIVHGNDVCFEGASSASFYMTNRVITRGQRFDGIEEDSKVWNGGFRVPCLKVKAGRHDSSTVARDFMSGMGGSNVHQKSSTVLVNVPEMDSSEGVPKKLNFYVEGTLGMVFAANNKVQVECPSIRLAQGGVRSGIFMLNLWWIGSRSCSGNPMVCDCSNGAVVEFSQLTHGSDHTFNVELLRPPGAQWMQQDAAVSEAVGNGSAALAAAAAAPRLALEGNSTKLHGNLNNQPSSLSAATPRNSITSEAGNSATATAVPAGETTSNNDAIEAVFYP